MGKLLMEKKKWKQSVKKKVKQVTKTVEITLPLELLHYCIQATVNDGQLQSVKATVMIKRKKREVLLSIKRSEDTVNLQLQGVEGFPATVEDNRWQCYIKSIQLPASLHNNVTTGCSETTSTVAKMQASKPSEASSQNNKCLKKSFTGKAPSTDLHSFEQKPSAESSKECQSSERELVKPKEERLSDVKSKVEIVRLPCQMCRARFSKLLGLKRHVMRKHKTLWVEYTKHHRDVYKVMGSMSSVTDILVNNSSSNDENGRKKEDINGNDSVQLVPCPVCRNVLHHNSYLIPHIRLRHKEYLEIESLEQLIKGNTQEDTQDIVSRDCKLGCQTIDSKSAVCFDCPECHLSYMDRKTMLSHVQLSHKSSPDYSSILLKVDNLFYQKLKSNTEVGVISNCEFCNVERIGRSIFKHLEICHSNDPNYKTVHQQTLARYFHQLQMLRSEKKRAYENKLRTTGHIYACRYCSKQFKYRPARSNHENFRCRANPKRRRLFECYVCGFSTPKEDTFKLHKEKHVNDLETANVCNHCGKTYKTRAGFTIHQRKVHNVYSKHPVVYLSCDQCGKKFYDKDHLNKHLVAHSDERPFQCELCGQQYKTMYAVNKHQKMVHYNKYTYHCDKCGHGVEKKQYLKKHICGRTRRVQDQDILPPRKQAILRKKQKLMTYSKPMATEQKQNSATSKLGTLAPDLITLQMTSDGSVMARELIDNGIMGSVLSEHTSSVYIPTSYCSQPMSAELQQNNVIQAVEVLAEPRDVGQPSDLQANMKSDSATVISAGVCRADEGVNATHVDGYAIVHQVAFSSDDQQRQLSMGELITTQVPQCTSNEVESGVVGQSFSQLETVTQSTDQLNQISQYPASSLKGNEQQQMKSEVSVIQIPVEYSQFFSLPPSSNGLNWTVAPNTQPCITLPPITLAAITHDPTSVQSVAASLPVVTMTTDAMRSAVSVPSLLAPVDNTGVTLETTAMEASEQLASSADNALTVPNQAVMSDLLQLFPSALSSVSYGTDR